MFRRVLSKGNSLYFECKSVELENLVFNNNPSAYNREIYVTGQVSKANNLSFNNITKEELTKNKTKEETPSIVIEKKIITPKITKKATSITAKSKTFTSSNKNKKITAILKTLKKPLKNKKITLKFRGKKYSKKTNSKGKIIFKLKLTKKGKFKAKITFNGDNQYKSSKKTVWIKIK